MTDVEATSDISSHPGIVHPEEPHLLCYLHNGRCSAGGGDVDRANTVVRINIRIRGGQLSVTHNPLPLASLYRSVLLDRTEDKSACLEVRCFSKLSGEGKQLEKRKACRQITNKILRFKQKLAETS